jgi:AP-3 complex subunit delta-1
MALMKVKGGLERLFDKNLSDLVRGIRNHKDDEAKYIAVCLEEIKQVTRLSKNSATRKVSNEATKLTEHQV